MRRPPALAMALIAMALIAGSGVAGEIEADASPGSPGTDSNGVTQSRAHTPRARAPSLAGAPCASATAKTLASVDGMVAERIYLDELVGAETIADERQVEGFGPLLSALAEGNRAAVRRAVEALVYSHTHIVRLRVTQGGSLVSDVGGPYIIAPVGGSLRLHGRLVGGYLLSVQDDLGFVGLETRFIGAPLTLALGHRRVPLVGTTRTGSVPIPNRGTVVVAGKTLQAYSFNARAFPTGVLRISLLLPARGSSARSCAAVKVAEIGRIGLLMWRRFVVDRTPAAGFASFAQSHTGALTYVRVGTHQIAGSTQPGPARLPDSGAVRYRGAAYGVASFAARTPYGPTRVYQLIAL